MPTFTDQRGTVHSYNYDKLGRLTDDRITTVGSNTDNTVLRISTAYEVRGMPLTITSYDNAATLSPGISARSLSGDGVAPNEGRGYINKEIEKVLTFWSYR